MQQDLTVHVTRCDYTAPCGGGGTRVGGGGWLFIASQCRWPAAGQLIPIDILFTRRFGPRVASSRHRPVDAGKNERRVTRCNERAFMSTAHHIWVE